MKILVIAQRVPFPPNKGEKLRTYYQVKYLVEKGHDVEIIAPLEQSSDNNNALLLTDKLGVKVHLYNIGNRKVKLLAGLFRKQSLSVANFYSRQMQKGIDDLIETQVFDAVLCTASSVAEYVFNSQSIQKKRERLTLLMDFMDLDSDKWRQYSLNSNPLMRWVYAREAVLLAAYESKIHQYFNHCFFVSEQEVELFSKQLTVENSASAIGNGIDFSEFKPVSLASKPEGCNLLFTGVMDYAPNVDAVVWFVEKVWPSILAVKPDAHFTIAGMRPTARVQQLTEYQGVEVTGFVEDIMPYFNRAHIFVAPFRIARGVQNKVLQAFACGLPTVCTEMGAEGINCEHEQHLLVANSADSFSKAVLRLNDDHELAQKLGAAAHNLMVAEYAWESKLSKLEPLLIKD